MDARYTAYLLSDAWQQRRIGCFTKAGNRCEVCGEKGRLQCHHLVYARIFDEPLEDLMALCVPHHEAIEMAYKEGLILKTGDPLALRKQTMHMLCANRKQTPTFLGATPKPVDCTPKGLQAALMADAAFVQKMTTMAKKKFKRYVQEAFRTHPLKHKMMANAHILFQKREEPKSGLIILAPPIKPISAAEFGGAFTKDLDTIIKKYSKMPVNSIIERLLGKAQGLLAKAARKPTSTLALQSVRRPAAGRREACARLPLTASAAHRPYGSLSRRPYTN
jgi:hypothetical protein